MGSEFIIQFSKGSDNDFVIKVAGKKVGKFASPIKKEILAQLHLDANSARTEEDTVKVNEALKKFGVMLFKSLFDGNPELKKQYQKLALQTPIVLQFDSETSELLTLPWEYLSEPGKHAKQVAAFYPFIRRFGKPKQFYTVKDRSLRLLIVIAEPIEEQQFNGRSCHDRILEILKPMISEGWLELTFLPLPATPDRFASYLTEHQYDIVHFIGHGTYGGLCFEGEHGETRAVNADKIRTLFAQKSINLVILTACPSGALPDPDPLSGIATSLIEAGIPAVVSMQFVAQTDPALRFIEDLYRSLIGEKKQTIASAVRESRANRYFSAQFTDVYQWGVPVIYLQAQDISIFEGIIKGRPDVLNDWPPIPAHNIIRENKPFVGRTQQMIEINRMLKGNKTLVLLGEDGIGKTALAINVALWNLSHSTYPGGVAFINLELPKSSEIIIEEIGVVLFGSEFRTMTGDLIS